VTASRKPVLVFGSGLTVLGAIRLLHNAGFAPLVVTDPGSLVRRSRRFHPAPPSASSADPKEDLPSYLEGLPLEHAPLLPCSDAWMLRVARCAPRLATRFPVSVSAACVLERLIDKWHLAELMREAGLPHPRTMPLDADTDLDALPASTLASAFIKPRDSLRFFSHFGVKAFRVGSRQEIATRLAQIAPTGLAVQLQEYIPGSPADHYFVDGFIDRTGQMVGLFVRRRLHMYPADFGNSTLMESVPVSAAADAVETVKRLLSPVSFRGVFSVEFKRDARDGVFRLIEVNTRPWWFVEFAGQCGVDVCEMAVRDALGEPSRPVNHYAVGRRCVYPYYDYHACLAMYREGTLTLPEWIASWATATQPVLRWSDPWPAVASGAGAIGNRLARLLRRGDGR
jgi:predicted ATP-grasp superfamily ATP-dependent carboligase